MIEKGFVKVDRDTKIDYSNNDIRVYMHLLMAANYTDNIVYGQKINVGQCVTSYGKIADALKISLGEVITAVKHLSNAGLIKWQGVRDKYSICTICDYVDKCKDIKYNFVMLNRSIMTSDWYKHEGAAKLYYYLLLNLPPGDTAITLKPVYLRQLLGLGHSQYNSGLTKLIKDKKITCIKVERQIQLSLNDCISAAPAPSPTPPSPEKGKTTKDTTKASSDTQYYF